MKEVTILSGSEIYRLVLKLQCQGVRVKAREDLIL